MLSSSTKISLRQHYRHLRRQVSSAHQQHSSQAITQLFFENFSYDKKNIAVYLAHDSEIDLKFLIEKLWQTKKCKLFLPVICPKSQQLHFVHYEACTPMKKNQYGIDEPEDSSEYLLPENLDIVLMPLVAFDNQGVRLGMGKAYYDKSFSLLNKSLLVGVAYQCQYCESLPHDPWDILLDSVITEEKLFFMSKRV